MAKVEFGNKGHFDANTPTSGFVRAKENLQLLADQSALLMNSKEMSLVLKSAGKFEIKNSGVSLKDVLTAILKHQSQTLSFLSDFIGEYVSHTHISPGFGALTPPPIAAFKAVALNAQVCMESPKVSLTKSKISSLMK